MLLQPQYVQHRSGSGSDALFIVLSLNASPRQSVGGVGLATKRFGQKGVLAGRSKCCHLLEIKDLITYWNVIFFDKISN